MKLLNLFDFQNLLYLNVIVLLLLSIFSIYEPSIQPADLILLEFLSLAVYLFIPNRKESLNKLGRAALGLLFVLFFGYFIWYDITGIGSFLYFSGSTLAKFINGVTDEEKQKKVALLIGFFIIGFLVAFFLSMFGHLEEISDNSYTAIWGLIYFVMLLGGSIHSSLKD